MKRARLINWRFVGPLLGPVAAAVAIAGAAIHIALHVEHADKTSIVLAPPARHDGLADELRHCQAIGIRAAKDPLCLAAWAENRRRFFGDSSARRPLPAGSLTPANSEGQTQP